MSTPEMTKMGFASKEEWYLAVRPLVESAARRVCQRSQERADYEQDAYVYLWNLAVEFDPASYGLDPKAMDTESMIARRRLYFAFCRPALDFHGRQWKRSSSRDRDRRHEPLDSLDDSGLASGESPDVVCGNEEALERVLAALDRVSPTDRLIVQLRFYNGLTWAQIAMVLGMPSGTARANYTRLIRRLREASEPPTQPIPDEASQLELKPILRTRPELLDSLEPDERRIVEAWVAYPGAWTDFSDAHGGDDEQTRRAFRRGAAKLRRASRNI